MSPRKDTKKTTPEITIGELTGGEYMDAAEVAAALGVSKGALRTWIHEKSHGGRLIDPQAPEGARRPPSAASQLLPEPQNLAGGTIWKRAEIEELAGELKKPLSRGRRRASESATD